MSVSKALDRQRCIYFRGQLGFLPAQETGPINL